MASSSVAQIIEQLAAHTKEKSKYMEKQAHPQNTIRIDVEREIIRNENCHLLVAVFLMCAIFDTISISFFIKWD